MQIFKKIGPRVILIEQCGLVLGLLTVKDCLKYTLTQESSSFASRMGREAEGDKTGAMNVELEEMLEEIMLWGKEIREWIIDSVKGTSSSEGRRREERNDSITSSEFEIGETDEDEEEDEQVQEVLVRGVEGSARRSRTTGKGRRRSFGEHEGTRSR